MAEAKARARELGRLIKRARRARGLTLRELDELTGVSYPWLGKLERGEMSRPAPSKLTAVAEALGVPPERIDRMTRGQVASSLPAIHTYLRTKYKLSPDEIRQIEDVFDQIRRDRREHPHQELPD
jgi:transcriptional regulator with XRE-family HTH domain